MDNKIVGLGEILWDVFPERKVLGGAPANFAYHVSQLGYEGYAVSAIGEDKLGHEILSSLNEKRLNYLLEETGYPTGVVQVVLDDTGIPQYEITEGVAWDNIPFTDSIRNLAKTTNILSFGSLAQRNKVSQDTIKQFISAMPANGLKVFDINLRQHFYTKEVIDDSLNLSNILKINDEEVAVVSRLFELGGMYEQEVCVHLLEAYDLEIVILTKGAEGSYVFTPGRQYFHPSPKVEVVDTVGAGDSFTAAFIVSYVSGHSIEQAHRLAAEVSAYVCTQQGAMPELPTRFRQLAQSNNNR